MKNHKQSRHKQAKAAPVNPNEEFARAVLGAAAWCSKRGLGADITPAEVGGLVHLATMIHGAVLGAGGPEAVPESVLMYENCLRDCIAFLAAHGIVRSALADGAEAAVDRGARKKKPKAAPPDAPMVDGNQRALAAEEGTREDAA
jgi:hypothetical protein